MRTAIEGFVPLVESLERNDGSGIQEAVLRLIDPVLLVTESQARLARASLASIPREESSWEMVNVEVVLLRTTARLMTASRAFLAGTGDPALGADLVALADELETIARQGRQKLEAEIVEISDFLAEAEEDRDSASATIMRRSLASLTAAGRTFPLAQTFSGTLRREAPRLRGRLPSGALRAVSGALRETRLELNRIGAAAAAALAGN